VYIQSASLVGNFCDKATEDQKFISIHCEWKPGTTDGADLVQVGLLDGRTFLFHVSKMPRFPDALKNLLQKSSRIAKVGANIKVNAEKLKSRNVDLGPTIDLGREAYDRGKQTLRRRRSSDWCLMYWAAGCRRRTT